MKKDLLKWFKGIFPINPKNKKFRLFIDGKYTHYSKLEETNGLVKNDMSLADKLEYKYKGKWENLSNLLISKNFNLD